MYVSVTGVKPESFVGWIRFWVLTLPASKKAQKAEGVLLCLFNSQNGYHHTCTVWESKKEMLAYKSSSSHVRAMKGLPKIGSGRVYGYETEALPSWGEALAEWTKNGRAY